MAAKTIKTQIIEILEQGEATHQEIAQKLGLVPRRVSAYLCNMRELGLVQVKELRKQELRGRLVNVWKLA